MEHFVIKLRAFYSKIASIFWPVRDQVQEFMRMALNNIKFSIQFSYENFHTPRLISKTVRIGQKLNTHFQSTAHNLSKIHFCLVDEISCRPAVLGTLF
jgi:hypothetical protein